MRSGTHWSMPSTVEMSYGCHRPDSVPHCPNISQRAMWPTATGSNARSKPSAAPTSRSTLSGTTGAASMSSIWRCIAPSWCAVGPPTSSVCSTRTTSGPRPPRSGGPRKGRAAGREHARGHSGRPNRAVVGHAADRHRQIDGAGSGSGDGKGNPAAVPLGGRPRRYGTDRRRAGARTCPSGLSLRATGDPYVGSEEIRRRAAQQAGAHTEVLDGLGHWWMTQDPVRGAAALTSFWASVTESR